MAKGKTKTFSISNWEKMDNDKVITEVLEIDGEKFEFNISPTISWEDAATMINYVVSIVFDEENGDYHPEVTEVLTKAQVLERYAHFNIPKSFDKIYHLVYSTDAYAFVEKYIDQSQLLDIENAIEKTLEYKIDILKSGVQAEIQRIMDSFEEFSKNAENVFSQVDKKQVGEFIKNVAEMDNLDEEKVVQLVHAANKEE